MFLVIFIYLIYNLIDSFGINIIFWYQLIFFVQG